jgi:prepilin-type N-terminal cleavage/methylation domain-containing protein
VNLPPTHFSCKLKNRHAFTLIEISIVLVIIGLIISGVLVGRELIRIAELRSIVSDVEKFTTSLNTFRLKYNCIPGDCSNATYFFPTNSGGCPNGTAKDGTCNGNGDGKLNEINSSGEGYRFWQQLALAGLIKGNYTGFHGGDIATVNQNIPPSSSIANAGYTITYSNYTGHYSHGWWLGEAYTHKIQAGRSSGSSNIVWAGILTTQEALAFDLKYDNGEGTTGKITFNPQAYDPGFITSCMNIVSLGVSNFNTGTNIKACSPAFDIGF